MGPVSMMGMLINLSRVSGNRRCHNQSGIGAMAPMSIANKAYL